MNKHLMKFCIIATQATPETRKKSREHWIKIFWNALDEGNEHLTDFASNHITILDEIMRVKREI